MKWIPLTEEALDQALNAHELTAVTTQRKVSAIDPVPGIIAAVAADIRGRVAACGRITLNTDDTAIPEALLLVALSVLRINLLTRFAIEITEARKLQYEDAMRTLRDVSNGSYALPTDNTPVHPTPTYHGRPQNWGYNRRGGKR